MNRDFNSQRRTQSQQRTEQFNTSMFDFQGDHNMLTDSEEFRMTGKSGVNNPRKSLQAPRGTPFTSFSQIHNAPTANNFNKFPTINENDDATCKSMSLSHSRSNLSQSRQRKSGPGHKFQKVVRLVEDGVRRQLQEFQSEHRALIEDRNSEMVDTIGGHITTQQMLSEANNKDIVKRLQKMEKSAEKMMKSQAVQAKNSVIA